MLNVNHDFVFTYFLLSANHEACIVSYDIAYVVRWDACYRRLAGSTTQPQTFLLFLKPPINTLVFSWVVETDVILVKLSPSSGTQLSTIHKVLNLQTSLDHRAGNLLFANSSFFFSWGFNSLTQSKLLRLNSSFLSPLMVEYDYAGSILNLGGQSILYGQIGGVPSFIKLNNSVPVGGVVVSRVQTTSVLTDASAEFLRFGGSTVTSVP